MTDSEEHRASSLERPAAGPSTTPPEEEGPVDGAPVDGAPSDSSDDHTPSAETPGAETPGAEVSGSTDEEVGAPDEAAGSGEGETANEETAEAEDTHGGSTLERPEEKVLYVKAGSRRRRPKYGRFGVIGGLIGLIAGVVLAQVGPVAAEQDYTRVDLSIVLVGIGVPVGILLGLAIALFLDRRRR